MEYAGIIVWDVEKFIQCPWDDERKALCAVIFCDGKISFIMDATRQGINRRCNRFNIFHKLHTLCDVIFRRLKLWNMRVDCRCWVSAFSLRMGVIRWYPSLRLLHSRKLDMLLISFFPQPSWTLLLDSHLQNCHHCHSTFSIPKDYFESSESII